jgi:hypothetical protein
MDERAVARDRIEWELMRERQRDKCCAMEVET